MTTQILTIGKSMAKEDLEIRIEATKGQAREECRLALKRLDKLYEDILNNML